MDLAKKEKLAQELARLILAEENGAYRNFKTDFISVINWKEIVAKAREVLGK